MDSRDQLIQELREIIAAQAAQIEKLTKRVSELELALAKATKDSSTSSKPPSSDIAKPQPKQRPGRPKKRRQGGQPGHRQHLRQPLPAERVDQVIEHTIEDSEVQRLGLTPTGGFDVVQQIELPESPTQVTEHRLVVYQDAQGNLYRPDCSDLDRCLFGPRLLATIGWHKSVAHCSYSTIEDWMEDVLQVPVSRGYLAKLCNESISASLSESYEELVSAIPHEQQLGSDETSIKDKGKKHWIWCITAATFSVFHIATTRSREVLEKLVGTEFAGFLNFDYFSANCSFAWNYWIKAQYCWAHLIRDIRFLAEKHPDEKTKAWAKQLLERSRRLFSAWHRREEMTAEGFHRSMLTHRDRFLELVRQPPSTKEASNLAARFAIAEFPNQETSELETYDLSQDYFRFMFAEGVEPTNNHSEQQIRHCVIDRKITQGTRGLAGQRYHERMWTAIATCKKQNRNFFNFLLDSIVANRNGSPAPSLID
jgi:transposase